MKIVVLLAISVLILSQGYGMAYGASYNESEALHQDNSDSKLTLSTASKTGASLIGITERINT